MAIATNLRTGISMMHTGFKSWVNLTFYDDTGISSATPLTLTSGTGATGASGNTIVVSPFEELPNLSWKCQVTTMPRGNNYLSIKGGTAVTG